LRRRRERIAEVERTCKAAQSADEEIPHLPTPDYTSDERIFHEYTSIEKKDLFGNYIIEETDFLDMYGHSFDVAKENPFVTFLCEQAAAIGEVATFEEWSPDFSPQYRVCPEEAAALVGGDSERADEILDGQVALSDMPKELSQPGKETALAEWVRERAAEYRRESELMIADFLAVRDNEGKEAK